MGELFSDKGLRIPAISEADIEQRIRSFDDISAGLALSIDTADHQTQVGELERERINTIFQRNALDRRLGSVGLGDQSFVSNNTMPNLFDQLENV